MSWTKKYKKSIDCSHPKGFSQKAHCAGRKARQAGKSTKSKSVSEMTIEEKLNFFLEKNCPTDKGKWASSVAAAKSKFDVCYRSLCIRYDKKSTDTLYRT